MPELEDFYRSMADLQITVDARTVTGKRTKQLRAAGVVPGVLFGKVAGSVPVQLDAKEFDHLYRQAGRTSIVNISVDGGTATSAVIKSLTRHPLTGRVLHVDFFAPDLTHEMTVDVPLSFTGEPPGVEATGGFLLTSLDHLRVKALPADLPHELTVDLTPLVDLEAAIHVSDIAVADNVTVLNDPDEMVARVMPPRVEEEPEPVVAEGEELEGEEGEEGEAPAEGEGEAAPAEGEGEGEGAES
jgi:large subunit ribosomal protein L25